MISKTVLFLLLGALVLSGCGSDMLDFKIRYQDVFGLRKDDRVLFEERHIGTVRDVTYTSQGDYLVDVSISKEFVDQITEHSRFYIASDPKNTDRQAVHTVRIKDGGTPIEKNAVVAGTTKYAVLMDRFGVGLRDNLKTLQSELNDLIESFRNLSESEQIKRLEKELDRLLADLQHLGGEMKHKLETEILPRIKDTIEELRRRLKELGREEELVPVERKVEELTISL
jgi:ABC-type transporter Mla subunit MlaD